MVDSQKNSKSELIMTSKKFKKLTRKLATNIVSFETYDDNKFQTCCVVSIGGVIAVERYALKGMEEEVLDEMVVKFWGIKDSIGVN